MKKYSILFIFFLSANSIFAQQVKWSEIITDRDYDYVRIIGQSEDGFYVLRSNLSFEEESDRVGFRSRHYGMAFFSNDMILKWSRDLEPSMKGGKIVSINMVNENVLVTFSLGDKKQKVYRIYGQYLNSKGEYTGAAKVIAEADYNNFDDKEKPGVFISQNQKRIACSYKTFAATKEEQDYHVSVVDSSLSVIYQKDFTVPFNEKLFASEDFVLSNEGGFYLFGIHYMTEKKTKTLGESLYMIYHCDSAGGELHSEEINPISQAGPGDRKFIISASPTYDNINHKIVVAGFYSTGSAYALNGTFYYALLTDTVQPAKIGTTAFDANFLSRFHELKKSNNRDVMNYSINRIILRRDGGAVILAEGVSITYTSYYDYFTRMYMTHKYYWYGNIIAFSVNPDGSILWSDVISKDQESTDDGGYYSSYGTDIYASKMFFVYNKYIGDNPSVLLSTIDAKGEEQTDVLINESEKSVAIPRGGKQIAQDVVVMPALNKGKMRFMKITF